jgi:hypothetical protein
VSVKFCPTVRLLAMSSAQSGTPLLLQSMLSLPLGQSSRLSQTPSPSLSTAPPEVVIEYRANGLITRTQTVSPGRISMTSVPESLHSSGVKTASGSWIETEVSGVLHAKVTCSMHEAFVFM